MRRSGKNAGPGRLRITASSKPNARMNTSARRKSWMFFQSALAIPGNVVSKITDEKKVRRTDSHPGELMTM